MLDLKKYLRRASADPGFKAKLIQNANQAIKEEFGEDLPYKLKCKEKIVFETEATDGLSESDLEGVAGGESYNADYEFSSRPTLPTTLGRAKGRLGARPYPKAFPPAFKTSSWRRVYHPGNYDDLFAESQQYLRNKNNSGLNCQ